MRDPDVLVVGGGLGGCVAALTAARESPDADVRLVGPRAAPFATETGLVDVLGYPTGGYDPVADPFDAIGDLPASHPYPQLGTDTLRGGLACFDRVTAGTYAGAHADENALVPTAIGGCRPAARYPAAVEPGLLSRTDEMTLVGLESVPDFDPEYTAARLNAMDVPFDVRGMPVSTSVPADRSAPAVSIARALDENVTVGNDVPARESAARGIGAFIGSADRVGLPAVLGIEHAAAVHATFVGELDADVFEVPLGTAGVLGRRLGSSFDDALADAGVAVQRGVDIAPQSAGAGSIDAVDVVGSDESRTLSPGAVVLATGGPAGGGIVAERDGVREPRFGCHVPHPDDREVWAAADSLDSHAMARFGVPIDEDARPLQAHGDAVAPNLFAAGRIVGGHDFVAEGSVAGVALATGNAAGRSAMEHAMGR